MRRSCSWLLSRPNSARPQVTTAPDSRMAAKALPVAWMRQTFLSCAAGCCLRQIPHDPRSQQPQIQEWQPKRCQLLGSAGRFSAALAAGGCLRQIPHDPRSQQPQIQEWQPKRCQLLGSAGRFSAALAAGCCLRQIPHDPRSQQPQIQEWQQKHTELLGYAERSSAPLAPGWPPYFGAPHVTTSPPWP